MATYFGSAAQGLGFFHIVVPDASETAWLNFINCGISMLGLGVFHLWHLKPSYLNSFTKLKNGRGKLGKLMIGIFWLDFLLGSKHLSSLNCLI
jgi:hypothetical protein